MLHYIALLSLLIIVPSSIGCDRPPLSQSAAPQPSSQPEPEQLIDIFLDEDKLLHQGYEIRRLKKKIEYEHPDQFGKQKSVWIDVSYTVVKKDGKLLAEFEGPHFGPGNYTNFGLFSFLGNRSQELIISTTVFRGGRHWVVSLDPEFRVLFDSDEYGVGREEFYVVDVDKDGTYEISLPVTAFYEMQDKMYIGEIPLPEIVFKYDAQQKKYIPANASYSAYAMRGLDQELRKLNETDNYLSRRLRILLRYIYAGREAEGWLFFDEAYRHADKEQMKSRIQSVLNNEPAYRYLHQNK